MLMFGDKRVDLNSVAQPIRTVSVTLNAVLVQTVVFVGPHTRTVLPFDSSQQTISFDIAAAGMVLIELQGFNQTRRGTRFNPNSNTKIFRSAFNNSELVDNAMQLRDWGISHV